MFPMFFTLPGALEPGCRMRSVELSGAWFRQFLLFWFGALIAAAPAASAIRFWGAVPRFRLESGNYAGAKLEFQKFLDTFQQFILIFAHQ